MSRKTPKYLLPFNLDGEIYSSSDDFDRFTVIDNELARLSGIIGDGVLSGWTISDSILGGLTIEVSPGVGLIGGVIHRTLSIKSATVFDNATTLVYMRSTMLGVPGGFNLDVESTFSNEASATFVDVTPPATPSNLTAAAPSFNFVNLAWNANTEVDLDHYVLTKSTNNVLFLPLATLRPPATSLQDTAVVGSATYYYRLVAVDTSGNQSPPATASTTTMVDVHVPAEITNLALYPGNSVIALSFDASASSDVSAYLVTVQALNPNGTPNGPPSPNQLSIGPNETTYLSGLSNNTRYRITIQSKNAVGNVSTGVQAEAVPVALSAPLDVSGLTATPIPFGVSLSWTASPSPSGAAIGQKSAYIIRVITGDPVVSSPINVGLATSKTLTSYDAAAAVGIGATQFFADHVKYLFQITTADAFGNESAGFFVKGTTQDVTPPSPPRFLNAVAGDSSAAITWRDSQSPDTVGYNINLGAGDIVLPYVQSYNAAGLTNNVLVTIRLRARDSSGNLSAYTNTIVIPMADTVPPAVPSFVRANPEDGFVSLTWSPNTEDDFSHYVVQRQHVSNSLSAPPNQPLVVVSSAMINVGPNANMIDIGLTNGSVYAYSVQAVDTHNNASQFSSTILASPTAGINVTSGPSVQLDGPTNLTATFLAGNVNLQWQHNGLGGVTGFNVYRSVSQFSNFALVGSVVAATTQFTDTGLKNGVTYYYLVTAVRDNATVLVDTGSVQPANTVLLGTVVAQGGNVIQITNSQRLVDRLQATIGEETTAALLAHKHTVAPLNSTAVTASRAIAMMDASALKATMLDATVMSRSAISYYKGLMTDNTTGKAIAYDARTTYVVNPSAVIYNVPFVGDYQLLVNSNRPAAEFVLDHDRNAIVFAAARKSTDVVSLDGLGLSFYVPARIDLGNTGFDVSLSIGSQTPLVDEVLQTVRFLSKVDDNAVVTVTIEPLVPDFGSQQGARQVSLSPNIVLNDFVAANSTTYQSQSGAFSSTDTVFILVNGARTTLDAAVDFVSKSIVFANPVPSGTAVSLQINGREEVMNELPASRVGDLDASQVSTGILIKPQLPPISHEGRIREHASPVFQSLTTSNKYVYSGTQGLLGTATTPYSIFQLKDGNLIIGTSAGILKTSFVPNLIVGANDQVSIDPSAVLASGATFSQNDDIVNAAVNAKLTSGRLGGSVILKNVDETGFGGGLTASMTIGNATASILDDGRILICGGIVGRDGFVGSFGSNATYIYNPVNQTAIRTGNLSVSRSYHTSTVLPNGRVLVTGGKNINAFSCVGDNANVGALYPNGLAYLTFLKSCEMFDPILGTWSAVGDMAQARYNHSANVIDETKFSSDVLVAGGAFEASTGAFTLVRLYDPGFTDDGLRLCNHDTWVFHETASAERFSQGLLSWRPTGAMHNQMQILTSNDSNGKVVVTGKPARELYDPSSETWTASTDKPQNLSDAFSGTKIIDGPIKQFFRDSSDILYAVTRNNVYYSGDEGLNYMATTGLESTGVVHRVSQSADGTLFAATDLGVYEITPPLHDSFEWFQGGLIGAGTTETFDLQPLGGAMLAATEIGVFSTSDQGNTWSQVVALDNVTNIELFGAGILFATSGRDLWRSNDSGATWARVGTYLFIDQNAVMVARSPIDLFLGTSTGLYSSNDGVGFSVVNFDVNRQATKNNVQMAGLVGNDLVVGYDNAVYSIDQAYNVSVLAQFSGTVPTVRVNGAEARNGFRYDEANGVVIFEDKRLVKDSVDATSNYSLYELDGGGWYEENPDAPVDVLVNGVPQDDSAFSFDARLGQFAFKVALLKTDVVTASISSTTVNHGGEYYHSELEDKLEREKGLPLSLGRDYVGNILQFGISAEHNFIERSAERDSYYCLNGAMADKSINSKLHNAEFYIFGRRGFDRFNSTIDYSEQSSQTDIGSMALVPLSVLEVSPSELWVGTDAGIFVLNPSASFAVSDTIVLGAPDNPIRSLYPFFGRVYAATRDGVFVLTKTITGWVSSKNPGNGLPNTTFAISSVANNLIVGTDDTIYYAEPGPLGAYDVWFRANFTSGDRSTQLFFGGPCATLYSALGTAYSAIGDVILRTNDGKVWQQVHSFNNATMSISTITGFAERLFLGTSVGVFNDDGSARSSSVSFRMEMMEATTAASKVYINDLFATTNSLFAVGVSPNVYRLQSELWTKQTIPELPSIHKFVVTVGGRLVALSNNAVFVE